MDGGMDGGMMGGWMDGSMEGCMDGWVGGWDEGWRDGCSLMWPHPVPWYRVWLCKTRMDGWVGGWDGWTDKRKETEGTEEWRTKKKEESRWKREFTKNVRKKSVSDRRFPSISYTLICIS